MSDQNAPLPEISVERIFNAMMAAQGELEDNVINLPLAAKLERRLHDVLAAEYLGDTFNIDEYAVRVDEHTPAGRVEVKVMLDGSNTVAMTQARTAKLWDLIYAARGEAAEVA